MRGYLSTTQSWNTRLGKSDRPFHTSEARLWPILSEMNIIWCTFRSGNTLAIKCAELHASREAENVVSTLNGCTCEESDSGIGMVVKMMEGVHVQFPLLQKLRRDRAGDIHD